MVKDRISIIIVTHNSAEVLKGCLGSLREATRDTDSELIVVDNNSRDDSPALVEQSYPDIVLIRNERNKGFARACNQGLTKTTGEYVLFLNPDVQLDPGCLESLKAVIRNDHKAGAVVPRLKNSDGSFQPTCRRFPTIYNIFLSRGSVLSRLFRHTHVYTLPDYPETTVVEAAAATVLLIRRSLMVRMSGFDERFFMYMEDTDLCRRLKSLGYRNYFVPAAGGVHDWGHGSSSGTIVRAWYHHLSTWRYFLKYLPNGFSLLVLPVILAVNLILVILLQPFRRSGKS